MASTRAGAWRTHCAWQLERAAQTRLQRAHAPLDMRYRNGLSRAILGDRIADELGLPEPR